MQFRNKTLAPRQRLRIRRNRLLKGPDKTLPLDHVLLLRQVHRAGQAFSAKGNLNLAWLDDDQLRLIERFYGEAGLFRTVMLAMTQGSSDFRHHMEPILAGLQLLSSVATEVDLACDNDVLRQGRELSKCNANVLLPSLSRKLFHPGTHHGYIVYGLGGPRILISHPFQGVRGDAYDIYENSVDVVTSLMQRGYVGSFLLLDRMPGLSYEIHRAPAWLLWFSLLATHSDLVLFVREYEGQFGPSQRLEIEFTPDRVQKKIVDIPHQELTWAGRSEASEAHETLYFAEGKAVSREDFHGIEAKVAAPLVEEYASSGYPRDRLIVLSETGELREYPLDHPLYGSGPDD